MSVRRFSAQVGKMTKVVVSRALPPRGTQLLEEAQKDGKITELITWPKDSAADKDWLKTNAKGATGLLVMLNDKVDAELIQACGPNLKVVSSFSAGFDHVDLAALKKVNGRLGVTPSALTDATANINMLLALMAGRLGGKAMRAVIDGKWPKMPWSPLLLCGSGFSGKTVGFIGFGRIAQASAKRLIGFDTAKIIYKASQLGKPASGDYYSLIKNQPIPIQPAQSMDELARQSDFLFLCCALTPETKGLIDGDFLKKMKPTSILINTARGPVVDSDALADALESGQIFGAGLDVITGEPNISADHPLVKQERCVVLPHIGSAETETRELMAEHAVKNLLAGLSGGKMVSEQPL